MGTQFGKYQLLKKIAAGGMAEIHLAKQRGMEGFEKIVVIKMILPSLATNQEFVQMFLDEARLAAKLTHPNIVQIFDLGRAAGTYFIAMEYIQGENLRAISKACRKRKQVIPLEHTVKIISQACEGLYHAHTKTDMMGNPLNVVHRDISPQNILVSFDGMTKIVDFGIAKATTQYQETRSGVLKGKYAYMSPEQCLGRHIDARSDLFSLGIVLWELATGVRLFKKKSELVILKEITEGTVTPPRQINQQIPAELEAIILKALEKNPDNRFQDALQMHLALEEFMKNQGIMSSTVHLSAFMHDLFKDKLDSLRKIEQAQRSGETLESFLFDDVDLGSEYSTGTGTGAATPSQPSSLSPSQPLYPRPTTGVSRVENLQDQVGTSMATQATGMSQGQQRRKSPVLVSTIMILLLVALGIGGYALYEEFYRPHATRDEHTDAGIVNKVKTGSISISSVPSGAKVFIDGQNKCTTPCDVKGLSVGAMYTLEVRKPGYILWSSHFGLDAPNEERSFSALLTKIKKRAWGKVQISSNPPGASIELDGHPRSEKTPTTLDRISADTNHSLRVYLKGRKDWTKTFRVKADEKVEFSPNLPKASATQGKIHDAVFSLQSRPRGASFYVDGRPVGSSVTLKPGKTYRLTATMKGFEKWADTIRPASGEKKRIVARLVRSTPATAEKAKLVVNSTPWANVFVDGKPVGQTPISGLQISAGSHTLKLVNPDLNQTKVVSIKAKPGQTIRKSIKFSTTTGKLLVRAKPWAIVYVDGKKIGTTPFPPQSLPAGTHTIRLYNSTLDQERTKTVQIKSGKTVKIDVNFLK